jgi:hypothetical protein
MILSLIIELFRLSLIAGVLFSIFILAANMLHYGILLVAKVTSFVLICMTKLGGD